MARTKELNLNNPSEGPNEIVVEDSFMSEVQKSDQVKLSIDAINGLQEPPGIDYRSVAPYPSEADKTQSPTAEPPELEISAAHTAIVLAKTQATAAREEARAANSRLNKLTFDLENESIEKSKISSELAICLEKCAELDKKLAVEQTRLEEMRSRAEQELEKRLRTVKKLRDLEIEKNDLESSISWWGSFKVKRRQYLRKQSEPRLEEPFSNY